MTHWLEKQVQSEPSRPIETLSGWSPSANAARAATLLAWADHAGTLKPRPTPLIESILIEAPEPRVALRTVDPLFWYLGTCGLYLVDEAAWKQWRDPLATMLITRQRQDGNFSGSWDPVGRDAQAGGRIYSTALSIMALRLCNQVR